MSRSNLGSSSTGTAKAAFVFSLIGLVILSALLILLFILAKAFLKADPNVQAAILAGLLALTGTLYTVHYNAKKTREQAAFEAHRKIKVDLYRKFLGKFSERIGKPNAVKDTSDDDLQQFFNEFIWDLLLFGGANVVRTFSEWKSQARDKNADTQEELLLSFGRLIKEMRRDIGETNENIDEKDILGALLIGGRSAIELVDSKDDSA